MKAFVFPGQGAQFVGMGKDLYDNSPLAKELFEKANDILGYRITDIMFNGTDEDLRQTKVTQPAVFLHSVISALCMGEDFKPEMTAGHSLGEFSALVAAGALTFEDGLKLVYARAMAMQKACEAHPSTMAAIIALPDEKVEEICKQVSDEGEVCVLHPRDCQAPFELLDARLGIRGPGVVVAAVVRSQMDLHMDLVAMTRDGAGHGFERHVVGGHVVKVVDAGLDGLVNGALDLCDRPLVEAAGTKADDADLLVAVRQGAVLHSQPSNDSNESVTATSPVPSASSQPVRSMTCASGV